MRGRHFSISMLLFSASAVFMALCRFVPGLARTWRRTILIPASDALAKLTSPLSFPLAEFLAFGIVLYLLAALLHGRFLSRLLRTLTILLSLYAALWYPAYWCGEHFPEKAAPDQLEILCHALIDRLNAYDLDFSEPAPLHPAKAVRYPEWMRALNLSGVYVPFTGEALVDPSLSPATLPFTARHELIHRKGVADEGAANIAAYLACRAEGGAASHSADLWALRYAMSELKGMNPSAWNDCIRRMSPRLSEVLEGMGGSSSFPESNDHPLLRLLGIGDFTAGYAALAHWLAIDIASAS